MLLRYLCFLHSLSRDPHVSAPPPHLALRHAASLLLTFTVLSYFFCLTLGIKVYSEQASSLESWFLLEKKKCT